MSEPNLLTRVALTVALALVLAACSDQLTADNYAKLKAGMTVEEVEAVLGAGTEIDALTSGLEGGGMGIKRFEWTSGEKVIRVTFKEGKLHKRLKQGF